MRDRETIDSELRLLAAQRRSIRERGGELSSRQLDALLDERLGHRPKASENHAGEAVKTKVVMGTWSQRKTKGTATARRKGALRRFGLVAALPLSLVAVAAAVVVMFAVNNPYPAAQPAEVPPSGPRTNPAQPAEVPPSIARENPAAPTTHASSADIVDTAFVDALKQEGVPISSRESAVSHGHAVCDFLAQRPNFTDAVNRLQQSSAWDANESADVAIGAIISYCPQYEPAVSAARQQAFQNTLSDLQGIEGDLQGIRDGLPVIPGRH
ncbi:MAG: DUF732 domain-containing protein [Mycobacterium sp.]|nr:DUF732 domain-containing protein [Mycobacterium sp.]